MRRLEDSSEAEMIAIWLRTELMASKRFSSRIDAILERQGIAREVVTEPDISDLEANALRRAVLSEYRGYGPSSISIGIIGSNCQEGRDSLETLRREF